VGFDHLEVEMGRLEAEGAVGVRLEAVTSRQEVRQVEQQARRVARRGTQRDRLEAEVAVQRVQY
jgi:hypothetical protein